MSGTRELRGPDAIVARDGQWFYIRFRVPRSTLGPVDVYLEHDEAEYLMERLFDALHPDPPGPTASDRASVAPTSSKP